MSSAFLTSCHLLRHRHLKSSHFMTLTTTFPDWCVGTPRHLPRSSRPCWSVRRWRHHKRHWRHQSPRPWSQGCLHRQTSPLVSRHHIPSLDRPDRPAFTDKQTGSYHISSCVAHTVSLNPYSHITHCLCSSSSYSSLHSNHTFRGLAHSGEEGVYNVVKLLNDELALAMKLMGAITISVTTIIHSFVILFT